MKVVVVTGASSGIGAAIVSALASKSYIVVGLARRIDKIEELVQKSTGKIYAKCCDVSNEQEVINTFNWITETLGGVDILVNSAGVALLSGIVDGNLSDWKTTMDINVIGLSLCTREALKTMRSRGDNGYIININSILGHRVHCEANFSMYSASKYAVTSLTKSLRCDLLKLNSGIRVTSISPGTVYTPMVLKLHAQFEGVDYVEGNNVEPLPKKCLDTQDIVDAVVYILNTPDRVQIAELTIQPMGQI